MHTLTDINTVSDMRLANAKRPCDCSVLCLRPKSWLCSCLSCILDMPSFGSTVEVGIFQRGCITLRLNFAPTPCDTETFKHQLNYNLWVTTDKTLLLWSIFVISSVVRNWWNGCGLVDEYSTQCEYPHCCLSPWPVHPWGLAMCITAPLSHALVCNGYASAARARAQPWLK